MLTAAACAAALRAGIRWRGCSFVQSPCRLRDPRFAVRSLAAWCTTSVGVLALPVRRFAASRARATRHGLRPGGAVVAGSPLGLRPPPIVIVPGRRGARPRRALVMARRFRLRCLAWSSLSLILRPFLTRVARVRWRSLRSRYSIEGRGPGHTHITCRLHMFGA